MFFVFLLFSHCTQKAQPCEGRAEWKYGGGFSLLAAGSGTGCQSVAVGQIAVYFACATAFLVAVPAVALLAARQLEQLEQLAVCSIAPHSCHRIGHQLWPS